MLSKEDNELMCRVGPGTAMGKFMREYWIPALMSSELAAPDCPPIRLRLLGENLIAFRVTSGEVGILANACPHRGASMFFGRNEEEGLRCVYHGWKFDVTGTCVDMPSEPTESNFCSKVKATAYPCIERFGVIWTYMGTRETLPPLPELPGNTSADCRVSKIQRDCNYMQALEGDIDTVHAAFLHLGHVRPEDCDLGSTDYYSLKHRSLWTYIEGYAEAPDLGETYGAWRPAEEDSDYWRIGHFLLPFYTYNGPGLLGKRIGSSAFVPIDDNHTMSWIFGTLAQTKEMDKESGIGGLLLNTKRPFGFAWKPDYRSSQTMANDYLIDRELQKQNKIYSGISGAVPQDVAIQESMGPIYDRSQEHLATTDMMVIASRRKLIMACKAHQLGTPPPGVDQPELYWMLSGGALVPKGVNGVDYTRGMLSHHPELNSPIRTS